MFVLRLDIDARGRAAFRAEAPDAEGVNRPVPSDELAAIVREIVWYPEGLVELEDGRLESSMPNLLMLLSDVRGRRFRQGLFLGDEVLRAAHVFRKAAGLVASGRYLPDMEEREGGWAAVWRPVETTDEPEWRGFFARCVDGLVRRAGRSVLEDDRGGHDSVHDAWLAALRSDSGRMVWEDAESARELMRSLRVWRAPLAVSAADRAALCFTPVPSRAEDIPWRLTLEASPTTRMGLVALGQAAAVFPPLRNLRGGEVELTRAEVENFLRVGAQALTAAGFIVEMPAGVTGEHLSAVAELESGEAPARGGEAARTVAAKLTIRVDGEVVNEQEIQFLLDQGSTLVFFRNRWIEVDRFALREALRALQSVKGRRLGLREAMSFALGTGRVGRLRVEEVKAHGWLRGLLNELRGERRFHLLTPPEGLRGELRDYQLRGYSWLTFLAGLGFGPCLADDMGLGKTVQTIAFILRYLGEAGERRKGPVLVVAPVSVTTNWVREFRRFAPGLKVLLHQGTTRAAGWSLVRECAKADVVVTGYSLLVRDFGGLGEIGFSALVLDEAQTIKNPDTRAARAACALETPVKIALTGTPLENSADDLWSLQECLNPGLLGARRDFTENFTRSIREDAHGGAAARLKHILEPFMLRRLKTDPGVAAELGEKREIREYCQLSAAQRSAYEAAMASFRAEVGGGGATKGRVLALLTELKLVCDGDGKLARLDELLADIFAAGESCLVFTQYAKVGRMLREHLQEEFGRRYPFLHGGLSPAQREGEIEAFNSDPEPNAFILSLKAGGFGLNLTRATHVIHFDRWWNPAVENQATDRAHRIGQTKTVFVHVFICAGTLEDHIDQLLESKRHLANEVVSGGESFLLKMGGRELERVLQLDGREA